VGVGNRLASILYGAYQHLRQLFQSLSKKLGALMVKKIALIVCDVPMDAVVEDHGDYHRIFTTLLTKAWPTSIGDAQFTLDAFDARIGQYPSDEQYGSGGYDAILITGSGRILSGFLSQIMLSLRHFASCKRIRRRGMDQEPAGLCEATCGREAIREDHRLALFYGKTLC
jgi:hypothetical protein